MTQTSILVLVSALIAGGAAGAGAAIVTRPAPASTPLANGISPETLVNLQTELEHFRLKLASIESQNNGMVAPTQRQPNTEALETMVTRLVAEALAKPNAGEAVEDAIGTVGIEQLYAQLQNPDLTFEEREGLWNQVREAGRSEELVDHLRNLADQHPNDPELAVELGEAYIQRIQEVGSSPMAGVYATQADEAFGKALELEPQHWEARFNKAVALSFWPPVMGKQRAAIAEFETLVTQQAQVATSPNHAQTHLLLGNMYQQMGEHDKAIAAWTIGAQLFPADTSLATQIALATNDQNQ